MKSFPTNDFIPDFNYSFQANFTKEEEQYNKKKEKKYPKWFCCTSEHCILKKYGIAAYNSTGTGLVLPIKKTGNLGDECPYCKYALVYVEVRKIGDKYYSILRTRGKYKLANENNFNQGDL